MTVYKIEPYVPYLAHAIAPQCAKMWRKLFSVIRKAKVAPEWGDLALWVTDANSATIQLRLRSSGEDDEDPEWESPPLITTVASGLCDALNAARVPSKVKPIKQEFYDWANAAILKSFETAAIQKLYIAYNPDGKPFSIFVGKHVRSFAESQLDVLWTNRRGPKPDRVQKKQVQARKGKKYKAVRKKTAVELRAESRAKVAKKKTTWKSKAIKKKR